MSCVNVLDNDTTLLVTFAGTYACASRTSTHDTTASSTIRFLTTGQWEVRSGGAGGTGFVGLVASGNWITGVFNPADYEIRFYGTQHDEETVAASSPCCSDSDFIDDTPFDSGWLTLNVTREQQVVARHAYSVGACNSMQTSSSAPVNVQIRKIAVPANSVSGIATLCAQGNATTSAPPCLP